MSGEVAAADSRSARSRLEWFRSLVLEPFRVDCEAWAINGWLSMEAARGPRGRLGLLLRQPGVRATLLHRIGHWGVVARVPGVPLIASQLNVMLHAIELVPGVPIGPGLYLPHTVGTVINARGIGAGVTLQGGITIGMRNEHAFPLIEDGAVLGAGCRVLGGITVGTGASVGANAVAVHDVAPGTTVVGIPARPVTRS